jgi:hypothetical protein
LSSKENKFLSSNFISSSNDNFKDTFFDGINPLLEKSLVSDNVDQENIFW